MLWFISELVLCRNVLVAVRLLGVMSAVIAGSVVLLTNAEVFAFFFFGLTTSVSFNFRSPPRTRLRLGLKLPLVDDFRILFHFNSGEFK